MSCIWQAGNAVPDDVVACTIQLIADSGEAEQRYAVEELWQRLTVAPLDVQPLLQVAMWVCGEFANLLNTGKHFTAVITATLISYFLSDILIL